MPKIGIPLSKRTQKTPSHVKGLVDSMSSFGYKPTLRKDTIGNDVSFSTSEEICDYLTLTGANRMKYTVISSAEL